MEICQSLHLTNNQLRTAMQQQSSEFKAKLEDIKFSVDTIANKSFTFYTGFPNKEIFESVLEFLNPGPNGENLVLVRNEAKDEESLKDHLKPGRPRKISPRNQFFLFLCRVRAGMFEMDLAVRFNVSVSCISNIIISWANFLYLRLGSLNIWPSKETICRTMPLSFKDQFPNTRVIIDATEIKVEIPSSLVLQSQTYSNYKSSNTLKGLVGISPSGHITFVSQLYTGSISDRELTERSGFLNLPFDHNDTVMADKGFDIQDILDNYGLKLDIPPFLHKQEQMSAVDVATTQKIANKRIHVERAISKIKKFHIFDSPIPLTLAGTVNQLWTVCALLTLFQNPIIS